MNDHLRPYAFLVHENDPYGREMLKQLITNGICPSLIIEESSEFTDDELRKSLERLAGQKIPPEFSDLIAGKEVSRVKVSNHNNEECETLLKKLAPELIILGGTRILKPHIFEIASIGCLNSHPGLLPEARGSSTVAWSIYHDIPVGCTCHFIDKGVDTGRIILKQTVEITADDSYESIHWKAMVKAGNLMLKAVEMYEETGKITATQQIGNGKTFRVIPDDLIEAVKAKIKAHQYKYIAQ